MKKQLLFLSFLLSFTFAMAQVPSYVPTNGLVGWWPFNGNANDESGNGLNGTCQSTNFIDDKKGNINSAVEFNGTNSYISIPHSSKLDVSEVTITCWYYAVDYGNSSQSNQGTLISKREASGWGNSYQLALINANSINNVWSTWTNTSGNKWITIQNNPLIKKWYFVAYTHSSTIARIFLNNIQVDSIINPGQLTSNTLPMWFGARPNAGGNSHFLNGKLDDIGIWKRALTSDEIKLLYTGCTKSITEQPVNQGMFAGNATFTCNTDDTLVNYQWQINAGTGWNNLSDAGQFSGTTTNTLTVSNVISFNNNEKFRCIIKGDCITDTTTEATLRVWGLGITTEQTQLYKIYPNPSSEVLNISATSNHYTVAVYNSLGQEIYSKAFAQNNNSIDVKQWPAGVYHLEIKDENNFTQIQKFIKQ